MAKILGPDGGDLMGPPGGSADRFLIDSAEAGGRFALVEHRLAPRALAAPLHWHGREDEYSFVLEGRMGAVLDGEEVVAEAGDLVFKPRQQWHTFWNASDGPTRILEIISPGGLEQLFRHLDAQPEEVDPETLARLAAEHGARIDVEGTAPIVERHGLVA